jgi:anti-sigma B factor antagonist
VTITEQVRGPVTVLGFSGSFMGEPEATQFHQKKFQMLEANRIRIVLDLSETTMINSSGLGSLISALVALRERGGDLRLAKLNKTNEYVMKKVQLDTIFKIFETVDQAVASFEGQS